MESKGFSPPAHPKLVQYGHHSPVTRALTLGQCPLYAKGVGHRPTELPQQTARTAILSPPTPSAVTHTFLPPLASCLPLHLHSCLVQAGLPGDASVGICFLYCQWGLGSGAPLDDRALLHLSKTPRLPEGGPERAAFSHCKQTPYGSSGDGTAPDGQ